MNWTIKETYYANRRYSILVVCPCGSQSWESLPSMKASGRVCRACKGKQHADGTYTPPIAEKQESGAVGG